MLHPLTENGARLVGLSGVSDQRRMAWVESAGGRVQAIAALGDGHGHDADGRRGEAVDDCAQVVRPHVVDQAAEHTCTTPVGALLHHRGQAVLGLHV